jgi:hypothetical protein
VQQPPRETFTQSSSVVQANMPGFTRTETENVAGESVYSRNTTRSFAFVPMRAGSFVVMCEPSPPSAASSL